MKLKVLFHKWDFILLLCAMSFTVFMVLFIVWFSKDQGLSFSDMSRDVISVVAAHPFTGLFSNIGIIIWGVGFTSLGWGVAFEFFVLHNKKRGYMFLALFSVTGMLYMDDFLLLHDMIGKYYLHLPEELFMVFYGVCVLIISYYWYNELAHKGLLLLLLSFCFLGMSAGYDFLDKFIDISNVHIYEDGAKFCGITLWALFSVKSVFLSIKENVAVN